MSAERRQQARKVRVKSSVLNLSALSSGLRLYYFRIGIESNWNQGLIREPLLRPIVILLGDLLWWIESRPWTDRNRGFSGCGSGESNNRLIQVIESRTHRLWILGMQTLKWNLVRLWEGPTKSRVWGAAGWASPRM